MHKYVKSYDVVVIEFFVQDIEKETLSVDVNVVTTDTTHVNEYLTRGECGGNGAGVREAADLRQRNHPRQS